MTLGAFIQVFTEFGPIFAFFLAGQLLPFESAVLVLVCSTALCLALSKWYLGQVPLMPLASGGIVIVTGLLSVYFHMPDAIILADTLYFWTFASLIGVGFFRPRHFLERVFDATFAVKKEGWRILSVRWLWVLVLAGFANEYVRIFMTPEFWIDYKFTKVLIITGFACYQFRLSARYRIETESNIWGLRTKDV